MPTPVLVLASETTSTPSGGIGTLLNLKELRLAPEDLIKEIIPSASTKDDVSALPLPSPVPATLHLLLDAAIASSSNEWAVHLTSSSSTVLLKGGDVQKYLESLNGEGEVRVIDFADMKAPEAPKKEPAA